MSIALCWLAAVSLRPCIILHSQSFLIHPHLTMWVTMQFVDKEPSLADPVLGQLLKFWPVTNSQKEVLFLGELEEILEMTQVQLHSTYIGSSAPICSAVTPVYKLYEEHVCSIRSHMLCGVVCRCCVFMLSHNLVIYATQISTEAPRSSAQRALTVHECLP